MAKPNNISSAKLKAAAAASKQKQEGDTIWNVDPLVDPVFGKGQFREYLITNPSPIVLKNDNLSNKNISS